MYEKCINEAELILTTKKDAIAPVHQVWEEVVRRSKTEGFAVASLSDFSAMLEGDQRFLIIPAQNENEEDQDVPKDIELEDSELGRLGFFAEDHVKLRNARVVQRTIDEDDEEIGSIRRKAFVSHTEKKSTAVLIKNGHSAVKKNKKSVKKNSLKKNKTVKKTGTGKKSKAKKNKRKKK
ncbi:MAG: hypothetical protein JXA06_01715 [Bacteroidetes bacterium]|nr:hypothetical protein [Bacteroidota bacterium]